MTAARLPPLRALALIVTLWIAGRIVLRLAAGEETPARRPGLEAVRPAETRKATPKPGGARGLIARRAGAAGIRLAIRPVRSPPGAPGGARAAGAGRDRARRERPDPAAALALTTRPTGDPADGARFAGAEEGRAGVAGQASDRAGAGTSGTVAPVRSAQAAPRDVAEASAGADQARRPAPDRAARLAVRPGWSGEAADGARSSGADERAGVAAAGEAATRSRIAPAGPAPAPAAPSAPPRAPTAAEARGAGWPATVPIAPMPPLDGDFGARPEAPARYGEDAARLARARALEAGRAPTEALPLGPAPVAARHRPGPSRWQGGLWVLVRPPSAVTRIAEIGELGASEAGMRLTHPIGPGRLAASLRVSRALAAPPQAEIAPGIDWRVRARPPVHLLVERRVPLRGGGPADWAALLVAGFHHRPLARRLWLDGYGQAGLIGTARPRGFADGAARLGRPLATRGRSEVAATLGLWGAAQPGAARIDAGPGLVLRLPLAGATMGAALDWRFRLAGRSLPGSGPALTLTLGF